MGLKDSVLIGMQLDCPDTKDASDRSSLAIGKLDLEDSDFGQVIIVGLDSGLEPAIQMARLEPVVSVRQS